MIRGTIKKQTINFHMNVQQTEKYYESELSKNPTNVKQWIEYIDYLSNEDKNKVKEVYKQCTSFVS